MTERYDAGLLNDFGGGDVDWWMDYIRAELDRAHDFYTAHIEACNSHDAIIAENERLREALRGVKFWAQQRCPCVNEEPNPCPLCGASVENFEVCKAVDETFPRKLLEQVDTAIGKDQQQ